jgi:phage shock protein PspC (stress-responsive transcriptional regulator)
MNDRLYRSRNDRVIAGVAGGLAERLELDPSLVRVVWVILAVVSGGLFLLVYLVMMVVVPEAPFDAPSRTAGGYDPWSSPAATGIRPTTPEAGIEPVPAEETARVATAGWPGDRPATAGTPPSVSVPGAATADQPGSWIGPDGVRVTRPAGSAPVPPRERRRDDRGGPLILGLILILVGGFFLLRQYAPEVDLGLVWPAVAVGIGILLVLLAFVPDRARR